MYTPKEVCELGDHMLKLAAQMEPNSEQQRGCVSVIETILTCYAHHQSAGSFVILEQTPEGSMDIMYCEPVPAGHPDVAH